MESYIRTAVSPGKFTRSNILMLIPVVGWKYPLALEIF
jgi:hypothetical protein